MIWIRKHPVKALLLTPLLFGIVLPASLNYSGMCIPEGRWMSDEERIDKAIQNIIDMNHVRVKTNLGGYQYFNQVKYENVKQFKQDNPNCCKINPGGSYDLPAPTIWQRITGANSGKVTGIDFTAHYKDKNGYSKSEFKKSWGFQDNCGNPYKN